MVWMAVTLIGGYTYAFVYMNGGYIYGYGFLFCDGDGATGGYIYEFVNGGYIMYAFLYISRIL